MCENERERCFGHLDLNVGQDSSDRLDDQLSDWLIDLKGEPPALHRGVTHQREWGRIMMVKWPSTINDQLSKSRRSLMSGQPSTHPPVPPHHCSHRPQIDLSSIFTPFHQPTSPSNKKIIHRPAKRTIYCVHIIRTVVLYI